MTDFITINHVCSLGPHCQSSKLCKSTNLKRESYPFDWIFSNPANIIHILEDDFALFLNRELYVNVSNKPYRCSHTLYRESMFNHHNPKDNNEHYSYFTRCVERFRKLLSKESNKLFILAFVNVNNDLNHIEIIKQQVLRLNEYISTKTTKHYMFVICHIPDQDNYTQTIVDINNIKFISLYTKSRSNGLALLDPAEDKLLQQLLLDNYSFQITNLE